MKSLTHPEQHISRPESRLNWLRAGVLGANDGIVSISGLVIGVAGATNNESVILTAGIAGIVAGAISMAAGEYVSVSSQTDSEHAMLEKEKYELKHFPKEELEELAKLYEAKGIKSDTARLVAKELTQHDALAAHTEVELGIDPQNLINPWQAAFASAAAFLVGAVIPLAAILIPPPSMRISFAFISVIIALAFTGFLSAKVGGANVSRAMVRVIGGGALAMAVTYTVGRLFGVQGI